MNEKETEGLDNEYSRLRFVNEKDDKMLIGDSIDSFYNPTYEKEDVSPMVVYKALCDW